jgi:hypothetical protein
MNSLPAELQALINQELVEGEQIIWVGQPVPKKFARRAILLVILALPPTFLGFAWIVFYIALLLANPEPDGSNVPSICMSSMGLAPFLSGLAGISLPYWLYRQAKRSCYAITNSRAIIWNAKLFGGYSVRSFQPKQLKKCYRVEYSDGSGDLLLEEASLMVAERQGIFSSYPHSFLGIAKVREVELLLKKTLLKDRHPASDKMV